MKKRNQSRVEMFRNSINQAKPYLPHGFNNLCSKETNISLTTISNTINHLSFNVEVYRFIMKIAGENKRDIDDAEEFFQIAS